ncbi:MAG: asparaginase [Christensenellales bacterium]
MKKILLIATGGTIAAKPTDDGMVPMIAPEELLQSVPGISALCETETVRPMNLDSTDMRPAHWLTLAQCVEQNYGRFDGFVIAHGTDTMAYTAAALSYLLQNIAKPVVLTGAQKSIYLTDTDARLNLWDAFFYALDARSHGVSIVFDGKAIVGTRARKTRTKSRNAFQSVDYPELALLQDGRILRYIPEPAPLGEPTFYRALNERVAVLKLIPGISSDIIHYLRQNYDALVIESFGVGGIPSYGNDRFMDAIRDWMHDGKTVVMTTQVPHEGSDMAIYHVGHRVKSQYDVIEAYTMTLEAVVTKLMWILAITRDAAEIRRLFYKPVAHDLLQIE